MRSSVIVNTHKSAVRRAVELRHHLRQAVVAGAEADLRLGTLLVRGGRPHHLQHVFQPVDHLPTGRVEHRLAGGGERPTAGQRQFLLVAGQRRDQVGEDLPLAAGDAAVVERLRQEVVEVGGRHAGSGRRAGLVAV
jgi:hypothetical protein